MTTLFRAVRWTVYAAVALAVSMIASAMAQAALLPLDAGPALF